ncbi:MAG TPA: hypothetical protein VNT77_04005 [Allosphingosinicella sp.]|nr:hypothetical protein [Allosphingosinicella sp.]
MAIAKYAAGILATAVLAAQPCAAAGQDFGTSERRSAAFGGLKLTMSLGHGQRLKPTARLQLTSTHQSRDVRTGEVRTFIPSGLEFGAAKGKPMLLVGGQKTTDIEKKMGIGGTGTTLLIVGGVVLVLLVVAAASIPPSADFDD